MNRKLLTLGVTMLGLLGCASSCTNDDEQKQSITGSKVYVVISDIHLGDQRSLTKGYSWNTKMKDTLCLFLDYLEQHSNDWDELIINGDFIDEWVVPYDKTTIADENDNPITEKEFFGKVVSANQDVFGKFRDLSSLGKKLTYIPGNHDMNTTKEDFDTHLPGIFNQARESSMGLGHYSPISPIFIEHGHRYDIFNAPYKGKCGVDGIPSESILPSGFFISKLQASSGSGSSTGDIYKYLKDKESVGDDAYDMLWGIVESTIDEMYGEGAHSILAIVTNIDGMSNSYTWKGFATNSCKLFNGIVDGTEHGWNARCSYNDAKIVPSVVKSVFSAICTEYCDEIAEEILRHSSERILVWGHSHGPILKSVTDNSSNKCIYLNTGCWIDSHAAGGAENTSTFGVIKLKNSGEYVVSLNRFKVQDDQGVVENVRSDSITIN